MKKVVGWEMIKKQEMEIVTRREKANQREREKYKYEERERRRNGSNRVVKQKR